MTIYKLETSSKDKQIEPISYLIRIYIKYTSKLIHISANYYEKTQ